MKNIDIDIDIEKFEILISILILILKKSGKNIEKWAPAVWLSNVSLPLGKIVKRANVAMKSVS